MTAQSSKTDLELVNPFWDIVRAYPQSHLTRRNGVFNPASMPFLSKMMAGQPFNPADLASSREHLVTKWSWAIPGNHTIGWLADRFTGREFVEIGAGNGYWAGLLAQVGIPVTAIDLADGEYTGQDTFHPIIAGSAAAAADYPDKVLLLCWPRGNGMATEALRAYQGDTVVYIGEGPGGCCAEQEFFTELRQQWALADEDEQFVRWDTMKDYLGVYQRC